MSVGKSQIDAYIKAIKNSPKDLSAYDTTISKIDAAYNKAVKYINDCEKNVNDATEDKTGIKKMNGASVGLPGKTEGTKVGMNSKKASNYAMCLRKYASYTSKIQNLTNTVYSASKSALQERNKAYKKALTGAFGYAKKNKGGK